MTRWRQFVQAVVVFLIMVAAFGGLIWLIIAVPTGCSAKLSGIDNTTTQTATTTTEPTATTGDNSTVIQETTNVTVQGGATYAVLGILALLVITLARRGNRAIGAVDRMVKCIHVAKASATKIEVKKAGLERRHPWRWAGTQDAIGKVIHARVQKAKRKR